MALDFFKAEVILLRIGIVPWDSSTWNYYLGVHIFWFTFSIRIFFFKQIQVAVVILSFFSQQPTVGKTIPRQPPTVWRQRKKRRRLGSGGEVVAFAPEESFMAGQPIYPRKNVPPFAEIAGVPYDQGLWKPIGFP